MKLTTFFLLIASSALAAPEYDGHRHSDALMKRFTWSTNQSQPQSSEQDASVRPAGTLKFYRPFSKQNIGGGQDTNVSAPSSQDSTSESNDQFSALIGTSSPVAGATSTPSIPAVLRGPDSPHIGEIVFPSSSDSEAAATSV